MANRKMAIPIALAMVLGTPVASFALDSSTTPSTDQTTDPGTRAPTNYSDPNVGVNRTRPGGGGGTRADLIRGAWDERIADLPPGHWATFATQIAVANNLLTLENALFYGDRDLSADELHHSIESLVNTAENVAGRGALPDLRAELGVVPTGQQAVSRLEVAQTMTRFLDAADKNGLVAVGAPRQQASQFKDLPEIPPAVIAMCDRYKIMSGFADHTFRPNGAVTRFQLAAIGSKMLDFMRSAPIAAQPLAPNPTIVMMPPEAAPEAPPVAPGMVLPQPRRNFRQNAPIALSWQALNQQNLTNLSNSVGYGAFSVIPVSGMLTGYSGPLMLQNVTNFRYNVYQDNMLDSDFRVGLDTLKLGTIQLIPYVGADLGIGAAIPTSTTQYDTYVGFSYGGIVSWLPINQLEIHANVGQAALLGAGRWNQNFQPIAYPAALGTMLMNYGLGADFYVQPNICLTLGVDNWQMPLDLRTAPTQYSAGTLNTLGGSVGVGFKI